MKRAKGQYKAAKTATDNASFTVNFTHPFVLSGDTISGLNTNYNVGVQALNVWDLLSKADNFQAFRKMYDQCRIDYVKVKLQVTDSTIQTSNANKMYDIYSAWDRTGLSIGDVLPKINNSKYVGLSVILSDKLTEYNGVNKLQLNAFQRWRQYTSIWPRNMMEKGQFISTGDVDQWRNAFNTDQLYYPFKEELVDVSEYNQLLNSNNPGILVENNKYPFKPTLLVGAFTTANDTVTNSAMTNIPLNNNTKIVMTAEFKVAMTFRGLRGAPAIT